MLGLALLRKFWWAIPLAALVAWGTYERHEATASAADVVKLTMQLGKAEQSIAQLQAGVQAQNAAVTRIIQQGQADVMAAKAAAIQQAQAADKVRVVYKTRVERIEAAPVPATCASAAAWAAVQAAQLIGSEK